MNVYRFLISISLLGVILSTPAESKESSQPNIVFIMADDMGYGNLGCYGQALIETPNIDQLATQGIRFTQAYAGSTVCAPSRGILLTGLHNGHAPVRDNIPHYQTYLQNHDITIAEVLKQAGYRCGGIGKWSLGDPGTEGRPTNQGFDGWLGYLNQDHAHYNWDYGHCRARYDQAVRLGNWKGIRLRLESEIQLYNLDSDVQEKLNVADQHPAIVQRISEIMETAATPSDRYPIGEIYRGKPIWEATWDYE
jgi:hypothetical protein